MFGFLLCGFLIGLLNGGDDHRHGTTFHNRGFVNASNLADIFAEAFKELSAHFLVCHLTTLEDDKHFDLVSALQKAFGVVGFGVEVVGVDVAGKLNFLDVDFGLIFLGFLFSLLAVKTEFTVVENSADGGIARRGDQDKIKIFVVSTFKSAADCHNAHLFTLGADHTDLRFFVHAARKDFFVDEMFLVVPIVE